MPPPKVNDVMRNLLGKFQSDTSGNIALIFAITAVPLIAAAGLALDYTYMVRERTDLQNAIDSAAISLAKLPKNTAQSELDQRAASFVAAYMPKGVLSNVHITTVRDNSTITINATADYPTTLTRILDMVASDDHSKWSMDTSAQATWGQGKVEVVMVLDTTGSMSGKKLTNLKSAANTLVDTLATQAVEADTVKIALVPFSSVVRLPTSYKNASWMDVNGQSPINKEIFSGTLNVKRFTLFTNTNTTWAGCVESRPSPNDVTDPALPSNAVGAANPDRLIVPFFAPDEPDSGGYANNYLADGTANNASWSVRQGNVAKYTKTPKSGLGPNEGCELQAIVPITTDFTTNGPLKTGIKNLVATGNTNIPMGLAWGWYTLSPNDMLTDNKPYDDPDTTKIIVLMTDGDNTISSGNVNNGSNYSGIGYIWQNRVGISNINASNSQRQTALDNRLKTLCTNINAVKKTVEGTEKNAIEIYTVLVELDSTATSTLLKDCATKPEMFYNVADSSTLSSVFSNIAGSISKLHLSK